MMCRATQVTLFAILGAVWLAAAPAAAGDAFYRIPADRLTITSGSLPTSEDWKTANWLEWRKMNNPAMLPQVLLETPGEYFLVRDTTQRSVYAFSPENFIIYLRAPKPVTGKLAGTLFWPHPKRQGLMKLKFTTPPLDPGAKTEAGEFLQTKIIRLRGMADRSAAGSAWFRHQEMAARAELGESTAPAQLRAQWRDMDFARSDWQMDRTYALFSGGRAISENLQLDRALAVQGAGEETVPIDSIQGITVQAMDWGKLTAGLKPQADRLAACIPADQHAIFFPSFKAMTDVLDEAATEGTPLVRLIEERAEDAQTRQRYEKQLCLATDALSRLIGPKVIAGVAFTGSDPYLRAGSDVAILFAAVDPKMLVPLLAARQEQGRQANPDAKALTGQVAGVAWQGVRSPDRSVCSYLAAIGDAVVVTNSLEQLGRIAAAAQKKAPALAEQPEYIFFRDRYKLGEPGETALVVMSDAAIRRWCGPRWRIGTSRRMRVTALMTELQARHLAELAAGKTPAPQTIPGAGIITWTPAGPVSSIYGSLTFMTPILELPLDKATTTESQAYTRYRDMYQHEWRNYFDPIAIRLTVTPGRLATDLTIMPLIVQSDFREIMQVALNTAITAGSGDPHPEALAHLALAINKDSKPIAEAGRTMSQMRAADQGVPMPNPLGWLGSCAAVYADEDPFWKELLAAPAREAFFEKNYRRLPVGIAVEVGDGLKLAVFLTSLRGIVEQSAPGLTRWGTEDYKGHPYTKISVSDRGRRNPATTETEGLAIYYASTPEALVVSPNERVIQRALDRLTTATQPAQASPWLGKQLALKVRSEAIGFLQDLAREGYQEVMQQRAWSNIPILNEWHRLYPDHDPVKFHERYWQTTLTAPGGGGYVWNEEWQTMESTVYGHPGQPRKGPDLPEPLRRLTQANLGVTFENDGLRGKAELDRK